MEKSEIEKYLWKKVEISLYTFGEKTSGVVAIGKITKVTDTMMYLDGADRIQCTGTPSRGYTPCHCGTSIKIERIAKLVKVD